MEVWGMGERLERKKEGNAAKRNFVKGTYHKKVEQIRQLMQAFHVRAAMAYYKLRVGALWYEQLELLSDNGISMIRIAHQYKLL